MSDLKLQATGSLLAGRRTRKGLGLLEQRQLQDATRLHALRTAVKVGLDDIQAGRFKALTTRRAAQAFSIAHLQGHRCWMSAHWKAASNSGRL